LKFKIYQPSTINHQPSTIDHQLFNSTLITRIRLIYTDFICDYPLHPCHPCSISVLSITKRINQDFGFQIQD